MNYIVTGGAGFIGSHLVEQLTSSGHQVHVVDNLMSGDIRNLKSVYNKVTFSSNFTSKLPSKCDGIFQLGFPSSSPMYRKNPLLLAEAVHGTIEVFEYASLKKVPVVYASTSSMYNGNATPWVESLPIKVTDYYTETRYYVERIAELYNRMKSLSTIGLRLFSVYGENEKYKGEYANLVSQFIWNISVDKSPLIYFDGEQRRDFIYQSDVVESFIRAMSLQEEDRNTCDVVNVGTGKSFSLNELVRMINEVMGKDISPKYEDREIKNYVKETLADTGKMNILLGKYQVELNDGIKNIISSILN